MSNKERNTLYEYFADDVATDFLAQAESNPNAAKEALILAASYIRRREALPGNLADYLAGAIEKAMKEPEMNRAKALTDNLYLTVNNRRPIADWVMICSEVEQLINEGSTQKKAFEDLANNYNVDEGTIKNHFRKYKVVVKQIDEEMKSRGQKVGGLSTS